MTYSKFTALLAILIAIPFPLVSTAFASIENTVAAHKKIWQTRGYGYVIDARDDKITIYDVTEKSCVVNPWASSEHENGSASQWIDTRVKAEETFNFYALHPIELTELNELPALCERTQENTSSPVYNFDAFWHNYAEHFPYGAKQNWSWKTQYPKWRSMVSEDTSDQALAEIFSMIINQVRDCHASLSDEEGDDIADIEPRMLAYEFRLRQAWKSDDNYEYFWPYVRDHFRTWRKVISDNYLTNNHLESHFDNFHFGHLSQDGETTDFIYMRIDGMSGFTDQDSYSALLEAVDDSMSKLLGRISASKGLVIDLRTNGGGTDLVSLQILSYLFKQKSKVGSKATVLNGELDQPKGIWVTPSKADAYTGPIVVLTSQRTASAAEIMLIGLTARQNTIVIGEPSNGSFSDILPKALPNGWYHGLSHQVYMDKNGLDHEEVGIPVDEYVPFLFAQDLDKGKDMALDKAINHLRKTSDPQ